MHSRIFKILCAALLLGAAYLFSEPALAGSCCGGGGGATLVLPKFYQAMVDVSFDLEKYDGFWNQDGKYTLDPPGSNLRQYRLNTGYARRFSTKWQASILVPYVWNVNKYTSRTSRSDGLGDTTFSLWYEAIDDQSAWKIRELKDLVPSITMGPSLLVPTGISPYDNVNNSFDVTGRGFYRLDGNVIISKMLHPWSAAVSLSYGAYAERPVNREYGKYVEPYRTKPGNRSLTSFSLSYIYYLGSAGDTLTSTVSYSDLREAAGLTKDTVGGTLAYTSTDHDWGVRAGWNHSIKQDGWGKSFPATDIYTIGVNYGYR